MTSVGKSPASHAVVLGVFLIAIGLGIAFTANRTFRAIGLVQQARVELEWARLDEARQMVLDAQQLTPLNPNVWARFGEIEGAIGRWRDDPEATERALAAYQRATELNPLDAELFADHAIALERAGRFQGAEAKLEEALRRDPNNAFYWAYLGNVLVDRGRFEAAVEAYETAESILPNRFTDVLRIARERAEASGG